MKMTEDQHDRESVLWRFKHHLGISSISEEALFCIDHGAEGR